MRIQKDDRTAREAVEQKIFDLLATRQAGATICPSEVARALVPDSGTWRELMPSIREIAFVLAESKRLKVTRKGVPVEATRAGGPIRFGLPD